MEQLKEKVLKSWLGIEFYNIANKIGFIKANVVVPTELIYDTIRCLDYETSVCKIPYINYVITVIALMWEYIDHDCYDVRKVIVKFLSRIGYPTSAIIADEEYDYENCTFSSLGSTIEHLLATLNQERNSINVNCHNYLLTDFQMQIWSAMDNEKLIGISAPTSAGKSFVILLKLLEKLSKESFDIVYIVPTLSLLNQVSEDFNKMINKLDIKDCRVSNSFAEKENDNHNSIFVLTQEKAISAFSDEGKTFTKDLILVVDEIQNIERIKEDNDERAKVLYDTLNEFRYKDNVKQIIIAGPRIEDIETTGEGIFGVKAKNITSVDSPVLNITYSIYNENSRYYLKQYCGLIDQPFVRQITNSELIEGYGKKIYDEKFLSYLNSFVSKFEGQQSIIFSPTSSTARKIACSIDGENEDDPAISELIDYYKQSIHPSYSMCQTLEKGIAYHHGKLPDHVRRTIEHAIHEKKITKIACTTTLLQGVNLPAQNIIVRNPHLYLNKNPDSTELSNYEMANLRGRAGRLLKDFIGRTFVLDESSFVNSEGYEQMNLFDDVTKELPTNYEERFEKYCEDIKEIVATNTPVNGEMNKYGDLVTYVRQSVLRYGEKAQEKMRNVGVDFTKEQVAAIILKLNDLSVPKEICLKNRYWDPFVLDVIYKNYHENVPNHPKEYGASAKLNRMLKFLRDTSETSSVYYKSIPKLLQEKSGRSRLCKLCMLWAKETDLSTILATKKYSDDEIADEIESDIEILQNIVAYKVPLLLKPIFDIKNPDSVFLSCMQAGACNKISRMLIEMGVPRECAIYLNNRLFKNFDFTDKTDDDIDTEIRKILIDNKDSLPYWIKVQLNFLG
ncbi:MAG: DEAD/DEAH box helicase [Clostridia bacterium]|nr:DEAD/DEAH box helicase [Clostridia bacterium]